MNTAARTSTVRAVVFDNIVDGPTLTELTLAAPGPEEVEVEIVAAGVCGSDYHVVAGEWDVPHPLVLGHEGAGIVTAVGPDVTTVEVGDHVVLTWAPRCNRCRQCRAGRPWQCLGVVELIEPSGLLYDGTTRWSIGGEQVYHYSAVSSFAERVVVPQWGAVPIRKDAPLDVAALLSCGVATGVGAVTNTANVPKGASVAVIGCGGVGLSIIQGARLVGADPIVAVDVNPDKLTAARQLGATHALHVADRDALVDLLDIAPGGFDYVFDAIGRISTIEQMIKALGIGGTCVLVGIPSNEATASFDPRILSSGSRRILGSHYGSIDAHLDIPRLVDLWMEGRLDLDTLVSKRRPLAEVHAAFNDLRSGDALRTLLVVEH